MEHKEYIPPVAEKDLQLAAQKGEIDAGSKQILADERRYIDGWRDQREDSPSDGKDLAGLALSGGGIRSATFSLGIMQGLAHHQLLRKMDYLSTVSGGGYIGSFLTWLTSEKAQAEVLPHHPERFGLDPNNFPVGSDDPRPGEARKAQPAQQSILKYLREHGYYLTPGAGISGAALLGAILRGMLLNLMVWIPTFVLIFLLLIWLPGQFFGKNTQLPIPVYDQFLDWVTPDLLSPVLTRDEQTDLRYQPGYPEDWQTSRTETQELRTTLKARRPFLKARDNSQYLFLFEFSTWVGLGTSAFLIGIALLYSVVTWFARGNTAATRESWYKRRRFVEKLVSIALPMSIVCLGIGVLPLISAYLQSWLAATGPLAAISGIALSLRDFMQSSKDDDGAGRSGVMASLGAGLFLYGVLIISYQLAQDLIQVWNSYTPVILVLALVLFFGIVVNLNYISIHRYYRDRLMETFMPDINSALQERTGMAVGANGAGLHEISSLNDTHGPYHIVNTNAVLVNSKEPAYKSRGGDNFILSPLYCGSNATGWRCTEHYMDGKMTLATAMAISGAAANPNTGVGGVGLTRNMFVSLTMSLLNLRLGYWAEHPEPAKTPSHPPNHFRPGAYALGTVMGDIVGLFRGDGLSGYNEHRSFIQLSDGGHFENMALYELIRRRVKLAIVCDGGADAEFSFSDMQTTVRRIEDDFGAEIQVLEEASPDQIIPVPSTPEIARYPYAAGYSKRGYMIGRIVYSDKKTIGWLIFLKTTMIENVSFKVKGYKAQNPMFPDQSTLDQFFDPEQFEAYRELGFCIVDQMLGDELPNDPLLPVQLRRGTVEQLIRYCVAEPVKNAATTRPRVEM
ncbi:MAG: hypothetical protein ACU843_13425 [Gammaproteobacteria bacterium]